MEKTKNTGREKIKNFKTIFLFVFAIALFAKLPIFAGEGKIILFYADWDAKSREAKTSCRKLALDLGLQFQGYNIDSVQTQRTSAKINLEIPSSVPYIYILDSGGKVLYRRIYTRSSAAEIGEKLGSGIF